MGNISPEALTLVGMRLIVMVTAPWTVKRIVHMILMVTSHAPRAAEIRNHSADQLIVGLVQLTKPVSFLRSFKIHKGNGCECIYHGRLQLGITSHLPCLQVSTRTWCMTV